MTGLADEVFAARLTEAAVATEQTLADLLAGGAAGGRPAWPARLAEAMRYASLGGGKRLRPFLVIEAARLFGRADAGVLRAAAALECVHCYSLVHDDLPAMDDDDLRRGRPTVHRAFDEALAILAGDALLTHAFTILADPATDPDPAVRGALVALLAGAAGPAGMVGGQVLDLEAEVRTPDAAGIRHLQSMKTGALIEAALAMGAVLAGAGADDRARLAAFGARIGFTFQIADDLLDVEGTPEETGKATAKDAARGKGTLVSLNGVAWARTRLAELTAEAEAELAPYGARAEILNACARFIADRRA
ncbi:polyprenyl synthetase family protein [Segnochrobactraceae bacterium EtOH-i3]